MSKFEYSPQQTTAVTVPKIIVVLTPSGREAFRNRIIRLFLPLRGRSSRALKFGPGRCGTSCNLRWYFLTSFARAMITLSQSLTRENRLMTRPPSACICFHSQAPARGYAATSSRAKETTGSERRFDLDDSERSMRNGSDILSLSLPLALSLSRYWALSGLLCLPLSLLVALSPSLSLPACQPLSLFPCVSPPPSSSLSVCLLHCMSALEVCLAVGLHIVFPSLLVSP